MDWLEHLRWHWGTAYAIDGAPGNWTARRRDNGRQLRGDTPTDLFAVIRRDYIAEPVKRDAG